MLSSGGNEDPPIGIKLLWGIGMALVLILLGGLTAVQNISIVVVLPFTLVFFGIAYCTIKIVKNDSEQVDYYNDK